MKNLFNINDIHAGVIRSGGTTPTTSAELRKDVLRSLDRLMAMADGHDMIINGDLLDTGNVPMQDLWAVVEILANWLTRNRISDSTLYLPAGNHDLLRNAEMLSSFNLLCLFLQKQFLGRVVVINMPTLIEEHDAYVIPHLQNQDLFNAALAAVPECRLVFLHANYDNKFAVQADHSLNVSVEQAKALPCKRVVFGHEHQGRKALGGKVVVVGNQIPTSVADCLGNDTKNLLICYPDDDAKISLFPVWRAEGDFCEMHWSELADNGCRFIRVVGEVSSAEGGDAAAAISRFRNKSKALVITNATKVEGTSDTEELALNAEEVRAFDVKAALLEILSEEEREVVENLLGTENV